MGQKISLAEQETPHEGKNKLYSEVSFAGLTCGSYTQGANVKEQGSTRVETDQCCFRQQERLQGGQ